MERPFSYDKLLKQYKLSIGEFNSNDLDDYYKNFLSMARSALLAEDISSSQLNGASSSERKRHKFLTSRSAVFLKHCLHHRFTDIQGIKNLTP